MKNNNRSLSSAKMFCPIHMADKPKDFRDNMNQFLENSYNDELSISLRHVFGRVRKNRFQNWKWHLEESPFTRYYYFLEPSECQDWRYCWNSLIKMEISRLKLRQCGFFPLLSYDETIEGKNMFWALRKLKITYLG